MPLMVLTANRLRDGEVIYLAPHSGWTESLQEALATDDATEQSRMTAAGDAAVEALELVEPYLMPVAREGGSLKAVSQREIIRAAGPTVRRDLGKQSEQGRSEHV